jgi:hypothetical protein
VVRARTVNSPYLYAARTGTGSWSGSWDEGSPIVGDRGA